MARIIIRDADILPMTGTTKVVYGGEIAIEGDKILTVGAEGSLPAEFTADIEIDGSDMVAMPGLINCHNHGAMTLFRGYADDLPLMQWLNEKIWPLEDKLQGQDIYHGTLLACLEMIKSGTTTFADMYFFMDEAARAVEESGMRAVLSRGLSGIAPHGLQALEENKEFVRQYQGAAQGRITTMLGPHAPYTCPPEYLEKVMAAAEELGVGLHIHLAETATEYAEIVEQYGSSPIAHVAGLGLFKLPTLAAHCVHLAPKDIEILAQYKVAVAHNPVSNMKLASGIAPVPKMLEAGVTVALGTDGASSNNNLDMVEEMRAAAFLHKVSSMDPTVMPAETALAMATVNGAKALGLEQEIGQLKPGMKADIVLFNFNQAHLCPKHDIYAHLVYAARGADVDTVIIDGELVMQGRKLLTLNETDILKQAMASTARLLG